MSQPKMLHKFTDLTKILLAWSQIQFDSRYQMPPATRDVLI